MHPESKYKIAVLGGTGKEGSGLALRWADAGHHVFIGSRSPERAQAAAAAINARVGADLAQGRSGLENLRRHPDGFQRLRGREPGEPSADDRNFTAR